MNKNKNPKLKIGDRIILVYMPGENLDTGTKGVVKNIVASPSFTNLPENMYNIDWYDDDEKIISTLSLLPETDSWILDPQFNQNALNESKHRMITDLDELIKIHEWSRLFKKSDLEYIMDYLEVIRDLGVVNMFQSGHFLGQTKDYLIKYFDLYRMQNQLNNNDEKKIQKILKMCENVRNIMISVGVDNLEQKKQEITGKTLTNRVNKLANELVRHFMRI